jgi:hypothetical protein
MTREGDDVVLPLYLLALVLELMVVTILPLVLCQKTLVTVDVVDVIVHCKVTLLPLLTV